MDEDLPPSPFIKKRPKGSIRPSGSTSSLRSLAATPTTTAPNGNGDDDGGDGDDADMGNVAVVRSRGKKTPAGRVKERQGTKQKSRLSFGGAADEGEVSCRTREHSRFVLTCTRAGREWRRRRRWLRRQTLFGSRLARVRVSAAAETHWHAIGTAYKLGSSHHLTRRSTGAATQHVLERIPRPTQSRYARQPETYCSRLRRLDAQQIWVSSRWSVHDDPAPLKPKLTSSCRHGRRPKLNSNFGGYCTSEEATRASADSGSRESVKSRRRQRVHTARSRVRGERWRIAIGARGGRDRRWRRR